LNRNCFKICKEKITSAFLFIDFKFQKSVEIIREANDNFYYWRGLFSFVILLSHTWFVMIGPSVLEVQTIHHFFGNFARISSLFFFFTSGYFFAYNSFMKFDLSKNSFFSLIVNRFKRLYPAMILLVIFLFVLDFIFAHFNLLGSTQDLFLYGDAYVAVNYVKFSYSEIIEFLTFSRVSLSKIDPPAWFIVTDVWLHLFAVFLISFLFSQKKILKIVSFFLIIAIIIFLKSINSSFMIFLVVYILGGFFVFFLDKIKKYKNSIFLMGFLFFVFVQFFYGILFSKLSIPNFIVFQLFSVFIFITFFYFPPKLKFLKFISIFSYELYLFHYPILIFVFSITHQFVRFNLWLVLLVSILAIFLSLIISMFINRLIFKLKGLITEV
jgi:peptidoglycan/LPS O-acetylase OafA/YrhL